ncbi:hypothetical protein EVAR_36281_1 [Eumeta japonica]|uniref:Uncharacterized protein n=1 Tax=Eumeta variegata TaxID=151549 RepID=A0A4C1VIB7_EUMVA|nr:hypothetical protein EVAR_36281_1 [Eumeta japonica]
MTSWARRERFRAWTLIMTSEPGGGRWRLKSRQPFVSRLLFRQETQRFRDRPMGPLSSEPGAGPLRDAEATRLFPARSLFGSRSRFSAGRDASRGI